VHRILLFFILFLSSCSWFTQPEENKKETPPAPMKLLWEIPYEFVGIGITTTPLAVGDSLVIMSAGKEIYAVEQNTGTIRWRSFISNETNLQSDVFQTDGTFLFATHVEDVRAYRILDGTSAWITELKEACGSLWTDPICLFQNAIYVGGYLSSYKIDAKTGSILWQHLFAPPMAVEGVLPFDGKVCVGGYYGRYDSSGRDIGTVATIVTLNSSTGDSLWTYNLQGRGGPLILDSVVDNTIFAGTTFESPSSFDAFDAATGQRKWSYYTTEYWDYNEAIIVDDKIIANAGPYHVCAFNKNTGQLLWRTKIVENPLQGKLVYYKGYVYHTQGGRLYIIDPNTGSVVFTLSGANKTSLYTFAVGNDRVFVCGFPSLQCYEAYM
jgi:outer membrane protein assembly factor BamB